MLGTIFFLLAVVVLFLVIEYRLHIGNLNSIPVRIHVNGTRGKSSVTRLIAGALREHGIITFAKTTGALPRMIMEDGQEYPIYRPAGANIIEQLRIVSLAAQNRAQALVVSAVIAVAAMSSVELIKSKRKLPYFEEKQAASITMKKGMDAIKAYKVEHFGPVDTEADPTGSGMIGLPQSPITSNFGQLRAKHATANPNWAAVMVEMFKRAGLKEGDVVAAGFSGSFPALNLATLAAARALKLDVVAISSVASSTWGANIPELTWLDMERILQERGVISTRSVAASYGGKEDMALGRSKTGRRLLAEAMNRNRLTPLEFENTKENIDERITIYKEHAGKKRIGAYVNHQFPVLRDALFLKLRYDAAPFRKRVEVRSFIFDLLEGF